MKIIMGSDHAGYELKLRLKKYLTEELRHEIADVGCDSAEPVDYVMYGRRAAEKLAAGEAERAILICGTGLGITLAANTVKGVRCINCSEPYTALLSRRHNNANALALGGRVVGTEMAKMIAETWLNADFEGGRHAERMKMIEELAAR